jgi:hypothetical protein
VSANSVPRPKKKPNGKQKRQRSVELPEAKAPCRPSMIGLSQVSGRHIPARDGRDGETNASQLAMAARCNVRANKRESLDVADGETPNSVPEKPIEFTKRVSA